MAASYESMFGGILAAIDAEMRAARQQQVEQNGPKPAPEGLRDDGGDAPRRYRIERIDGKACGHEPQRVECRYHGLMKHQYRHKTRNEARYKSRHWHVPHVISNLAVMPAP